MNEVITKTITDQANQQTQLSHQKKKDNGVFFTNELKIVDSILDVIEFDNGIIEGFGYERGFGGTVERYGRFTLVPVIE